MNKDTGGPAFPTTPDCYIQTSAVEGGMTLLDYFAGQAMQGTLIFDGLKKRSDGFGYTARVCYNIAEAMIAEKRRREK